MNDIPLTGRPQAAPTLGQARSQVTARVYDRSTAARAPNADLAGLVSGLQSLNPTLQALGNQYFAEQREAAVELAKTTEAKSTADPRDALTGAPVEVPSTVPPAFDGVYRDAYQNLSTQRAALAISQDILGEYEAQKATPGFNAKAFMAEKRQASLAGLTDAHRVGIMDSHLTQLEGRINADFQGLLQKRHEEERKTTMFTMTEQALDPIMEPETLAERGHWLLGQGASIQVLPQDAGKAIVRRVRSMAGDRPELFDAFDVPDASGVTLRAKFPELSEEIDVGRRQAEAAREQAIHRATEVDRFESFVEWNRAVDERPDYVVSDAGMEALRSQIGVNGFTANQAASLVDAAYTQLAKRTVGAEIFQASMSGTLGRYPEEAQKKELERILGPALDSAWAIAAGNVDATPQQRTEAITALATQILTAREQTGATAPVDALARLLNRAVTSLPNPEGPTPDFLASAELYRALEPNSQYRDMHLNEKSQDLLSTYTVLTQTQGMDPAAAYERAYFIHSDENKERAKARLSDPKFIKEVEETAQKAATGSTMFRLWGLVGPGRPVNTEELGVWASVQAKAVAKQNPHLTPDEVLKKVESMTSQAWIVDGTSRRAIQVPQGINAEAAQVAITELTEELTSKYKKQKLIDSDGYVHLMKIPGGNDAYRVVLESGAGQSKVPQDLGQIRLGETIDRYRQRKTLSKDEAIKLQEVKLGVDAGSLVGIDPALLEKGVQTKMISSSTVAKYKELQRKSVMDRMAGNPTFSLEAPTGNNTMKPKVDRQATTSLAMQFAYGSGLNAATHGDLAASLVTVREGVVLSAYGDPAKGAGLNIGAGYNLKANAATVNADLKAVGVPAARVADVVEGRAALTTDQVRALTKLTLDRFEPQVIKVAEATKPGLWKSLTPQQRAVMLDISYQTGDPGSYKKAWAALASGDGAAFKQEVRTFYTNQRGERVEDTRAMDLRSSLLNGPSAWKARLMVASK